MKKFEVGYVTESPAGEYAKAIREAKSKEELVKTIEYYAVFAPDALAQAKKFTDKDFKDYKKMLPLAKLKQKQAWIEDFIDRFGDITVPIMLVKSELIAEAYKAPWGCAFIRMVEIEEQEAKKKSKKKKS